MESDVDEEEKPTLLTIPPELREIIYKYTYEDSTVTLQPQSNHHSHGLGLLLACKITYLEALPVYYSHSALRCPDWDEIAECLCRHGVEVLEVVPLVLIDYDPDDEPHWRHYADPAFEAQAKLMLLKEKLTTLGCPEVKEETFQVELPIVGSSLKDGVLIVTPTPWKTFDQFFSFYTLADDDPSPSLYQIKLMSRFFDHDHKVPSACWTYEWMTDPGWVCECPKKAVHKEDVVSEM